MLIICVERLNVDLNLVIGSIEVVVGSRVDVITLTCNPHCVAASDFPTRSVSDASFNVILPILARISRSIKNQSGLAIRIGFQRLALNDLSAASSILKTLRTKVRVVPGILLWWSPVVVKGILINHDLNAGIIDCTAKIVVGAQRHLHFLAKSKSLFVTVDFRSSYGNFELRKFVFFQAKQICTADCVLTPFVEKDDLISTQSHRIVQLECVPGAAKVIQGYFFFLDFIASRIANFVFDDLVRRS